MRIETIEVPGYERVLYAEDSGSGLKAIISIHNTNLGPACGGIRLLPYASKKDALEDVLRLSKGMSYKSALANLKFGGGKSVIIADPKQKNEKLFHAFGEFVDSVSGKYIAAKDMNINSADLLIVKEKTKHVLGIDGVPGSSGDPSPLTARGAMQAFRAVAQTLWGTKSLAKRTVAIQGLGHVGFDLARRLHADGARIVATDTNPDVLKKAEKELGAKSVSLETIYDEACDIFSPCARGAILNPTTIPRLKCQAVVGCANNQLADPQDGLRLYERGILYAPDFAVNAGGIINVYVEHVGYNAKLAEGLADQIFDTIGEILKRSKAEKRPPFIVADLLAEEKINGGAREAIRRAR